MKNKPPKPHVCLVCWNTELAASRARALAAEGFRVSIVDREMGGWIGFFRDLELDAVVIDLDRLPSHGREVGILLRGSKSTRHLPLVYLGGPPEKVERLQNELPDATYAAWPDAAAAIRAAIANPVERPVRPLQMMERNRDADLARRLGITPAVHVVFWGQSDFLRDLLRPANSLDAADTVPITSSRRMANLAAETGDPQLWLCVAQTAADLAAAFDALTFAAHAKVAGWIIHPKQTSRYHTDFNQNDVRDHGLALGWVDCKVCAVDADWSALKFARRKSGIAKKRMAGKAGG